MVSYIQFEWLDFNLWQLGREGNIQNRLVKILALVKVEKSITFANNHRLAALPGKRSLFQFSDLIYQSRPCHDNPFHLISHYG